MRARVWGIVLALLASMAATAPVLAQEAGDPAAPALRSPILTIDVERLYAESQFGRGVDEEYRRRSEALANENRQIEADLTAEEQSLTRARATMTPADFRAAADAFDQKVQSIRAAQDTKQQDLLEVLSSGRETFMSTITQDLADLMAEAGAAVILDRRSVFLSAGVIDITTEALTRIDETYANTQAASPAP
ncbi:hypothetical protein BVG79_01001 [Ketogulonicigenium robustum]|uniref:Outer membrane chaperone Skp n=1 Tax=Ketogulonicigenium robustum TaxID=92947 RepID=A0A1W6NZ93_9RHOB|nr:OmpH family outer membrane protein [Ketogulonicigenium robustum]ARO14347.1 hypothetical protein BVG79_01001 [Ketogulonicigenium robustum]